MYLFLDTETGGLSPDYSLLTVAAATTDENFNITNRICFGILPAGFYVVSPAALRVNKINLAEHSVSSLSLAKANEELTNFLKDAMAHNSNKWLIPAGHNLKFDLDFIWAQLMPEEDWKKFCTYPVLDTAVLARFFASIGKIPGFYNLVSLRQLFQIETGEAHNAMSDVLATIELAKKFTAIAKGEQIL